MKNRNANVEAMLKRFMSFILIFTSLHMSAPPCMGDTLKVATLDFPPFQYEENGTPRGLALDVVTEIFRRMNRQIEITFYPFPRAIQNIQDGTADIIFTFYYKKEREKFVDYSREPLVKQSISLFVPRDSPVDFDGDLSKLNRYSFGLVRFSYGRIFDDAIKEGLITDIEYVSEMRLNMKKFLHRRFDILPSDRWVAFYYYSKLAANDAAAFQIKELKPPIQTFPAFIGFSKLKRLGSLRDKVDQTLREMKRDGTYPKIRLRHSALWEPGFPTP